jgi:ABC-type lipoprotein release transport system permease subunit
MRLSGLVVDELRHRWLNSALGLLTALIAVACLIAALALLREHRLATEAIITAKEEETRARLAILADDMRRITVRMGFNILILPKDQNLGDFYADDYASRTMPEDYAERLGASGVATINHILPSLQRKLRWQEQERTVLLIGVRGEVPIASNRAMPASATTTSPGTGLPPAPVEPRADPTTVKDGKPKKPLLPTIPRGTAMLGHDLHRSLQVKAGDTFRFQGRTFSVSECRPVKGTKDDISLWIDLAEAQELLDLPGRINAILALECNCAAEDRLGEIRAEVARILPDTQVIEYESKALARAEARNRAEAEGVAAIAAERDRRIRLEQEKERLAGAVVPLALLICGVLIGLLSWQNVRERAMEIAILRTLGLGTGRIMGLVLFRAVAIGLSGSVLGYAVGLLGVNAWAGTPAMAEAVRGLLTPAWLITAVAAGPTLALAAAWLPALAATQQDPADLLREG